MSNKILDKGMLQIFIANLMIIFFFNFISNVNSLEEGTNNYVYNENDILIFLTKDGYLFSYKKDKNNNINENWKIYFGDYMTLPDNINSNIISKNIYTFMINDKLYIIKDNVLIPFNEFVTNLVNNNNYVNNNDDNDSFLKGKIKLNYLIIDLIEGKILEEIKEVNEDSIVLKKFKNYENAIILKKIEYTFQKVDKISKKIIMNIGVSDVIILNRESYDNKNMPFENKEYLEKLLGDLTIKLECDKIISMYNYSLKRKKINLLYNKNIFEKTISKSSSNEKEIKDLIKENNSILNKLFKYDIINTFLVIFSTTIILLLFKSFSKKQSNNISNINIINKNYTKPSTNEENTTIIPDRNLYEVCKNVENISYNPTNIEKIDDKEKDEENNKLVKYCPNKYVDIIQDRKKNFYKLDMVHCHSSNDLVGRKSFQLDNIDDNNNNNFLIAQNIQNFELINKFIEVNEPNIKKIIEPPQNEYKIKKSYFDPIKKQVYIKIEEIIKNNISFKIPENKFNEYKNYLQNNKTKLLAPKETENSISEKSESKIGIWDDSIDESINESKKIIIPNINDIDDNKKVHIIKNNGFNDNNIINNKLENKTNDNDSVNSDDINKYKKIRRAKSRLDQDFKNLEKIGEGGFGVVLKGIHRLDKGINAIKIIKLSKINNKENIINEAITMTRISSKHIVQYKTCWIDNKLGSASKFFRDQDNSEEEDEEEEDEDKSRTNIINKQSKSCIMNKNKKNKNYNDSDSLSDSEDSDDNYDFLPIKRNVSKDLLNVKNKDNNSQEINKRKNPNALTKYYNDYRDDLYILKESFLSKKLNKDNNDNNNINNSYYSINSHYGKYFFILMEYCDGLTLEKYIKAHINSSIDRKIIYTFTYQLLKSLSKIHSGGIIHRDIKPSNIFIKDDQIKIGDFGLATRKNRNKLLKSKKIEGTPLYLSPEQTAFKTYNEKVDIYACGITLYEMCSCFYTSMERYESINNLKNNQIVDDKVCKNYPEEAKLIKLMTKPDYNERPSANDILKSDLFVNLGKKLGY